MAPVAWAATPMRPPFEVAERDGVALSRLAQHEIGREAHILEDDLAGVVGALAHLCLVARDPVALGLGRHQGSRLIPFLPASGSVTAKTSARSALEPLETNCLVPLSR